MSDSPILVKLGRVWTAYPDDVYQALCQARKNGTKIVELVMQSDPTIPYMRFYSKYYVDFDQKKQYNAHTNKTRDIKFDDIGCKGVIPKLKGKLAKITATACVPNIEKYTVEKTVEEEKQKSDDCALILTKLSKEFLAYAPDVHGALQKAYCDGYMIVEFVILSDPGEENMNYYSRYIVDFTSMMQHNVHTQKSRQIRFVTKADKDKKNYKPAPGKLAKDPQAVKTLGTNAPKSLLTGNVSLSPESPASAASVRSIQRDGSGQFYAAESGGHSRKMLASSMGSAS